jgi:hypothetical protein
VLDIVASTSLDNLRNRPFSEGFRHFYTREANRYVEPTLTYRTKKALPTVCRSRQGRKSVDQQVTGGQCLNLI